MRGFTMKVLEGLVLEPLDINDPHEAGRVSGSVGVGVSNYYLSLSIIWRPKGG